MTTKSILDCSGLLLGLIGIIINLRYSHSKVQDALASKEDLRKARLGSKIALVAIIIVFLSYFIS